MKTQKLSPIEQLESDKKHLRLIALGMRAKDIAESFGIDLYDEGNKRKKLYGNYCILNTREATQYAIKHKMVTQQEVEDTLAPAIVFVDWSKIKDIP